MPRYRRVSVQIWNDEHFSAASERGQLCFAYILTHPQMTSLGALRHTIPGLAAERGLSEKDFRDAIAYAFRDAKAKASGLPMLEVDEQRALIVLPNFLKHNPPESINVVKSWGQIVELLPECPLLTRHLQRVKAYVYGMSKGFRDALPDAIRDAKAIPDPDPDPDPDLNTSPNGEVCPEPAEREFQTIADPLDPIVHTFQCRGKQKTWVLRESTVAKYEADYPELNVRQQLRNAWRWTEDKPSRRKTANGMLAFLTGWLNRACNSGQATRAEPDKPKGGTPYL